MIKPIGLTALAATALSACVSYEFVPPTTDTGRRCVMECESVKQQCSMLAEARAESEARECRQERTVVLSVCLATAKDKAQKDRCYDKSDSCIAIPATAACDTTHRRCYATCGGQVIERSD